MPTARQLVPSAAVRFDAFELRLDEGILLRHGQRLKLQPQPFRVLAYLVARAPSVVSRGELGDHIWGSGVHVDLDQSLNYCVRQIRQVLEDDAALPRYVETLPRQGYRFIFPMEAVAPVEVTVPSSGPVAEAHPDAQKRPDLPLPQSPDLPVTPPCDEHRTGKLRRLLTAGRRTWFLAVVALLVLAGVVAAVRVLVRGRGSDSPIRSLAVLPLENLSGDPGQVYLADGMTEELTNTLAKASTLRIVPRSSVLQYSGAHLPLAQIARALGVDAMLEGSFSRSGTRTHLTLQLIRANGESHLWANSYDSDVNDPSVADVAARTIAKQLNHAVPPAEPVRFIATAAHDAYLRGRYLWPTDRMEESGEYFRKATEIQPDYAEAWAGLANYYGEGIAAGVLDPRTAMQLQEQAAQRALALAPNLALAHQAMAAAYLIDRWDAQAADREVLQAIHLDPSDATSLYLRANVLEALNRFPEAIQVEQRSMEMAPYERREGLAAIYLYARQYDEALAELKLRMEAAPNDPTLLDTAALVWRSKGNYREAMEAQAKSYLSAGDTRSAAELRQAFERGGARAMVRWQLDQRLRQAKSHYVSPVALACYYAQLGDRERTLSLLDEGYRQRSTDMLWVPGDPAYDFLHDDKRYQALVHTLAGPTP